MEYKVQHITNKNKIIRDMEAKSLTIHSTANLKSTAQNERDNLNRIDNTSSTGFHLVVDDTQAIECIPFNKVAYHAGDGANGLGNSTSIGLEICESGNRSKAIENAVTAAAKILHERNWDIDKLKRHFDWSGKNCPRILSDNNWKEWNEFKSKVQAHINSLNQNNSTTGKLYRVQVGAYTVKANADRLLEDLKKAGFTGYIKEDIDLVNPITPIKPVFPIRTGRYIEHGLEIIEHPPEDWYTAFMQGKNLKQLGVNGVNWAFQNNSEAHLTRAIWSLLANKNGAIGENSYQNGINGIKRGTMIYYQDGTLDIVRIDNLKEISKPIVWAIGGGSLIPNIIPEEKFASDIYRKTIHTGAGYRGNRVLAFVSLDNCTMEEFRQKVLKLELDAGIFGDGGLSSQQNYKGEGRFSLRGLASGFLVKGVK